MKWWTNLVLQQCTNTWFHQKMNFISMTLSKYCIVGAASLPLKVHSYAKKKLYMRWGWLWIHLTHNSTNLKTTLPTQRPTFGVRCVMSFTKPAMCRQKWNVLVKSSPPETRTRRKWWRGERLPHHGPILSSTIMSIFCEHSKPATPARCPLQVSYIRVKTCSTHFSAWIDS